MKVDHALNFEREYFIEKMTTLCGDRVKTIEMVCLKASKPVFDYMKLIPSGSQSELWGLLIFCKKSMHFYVHPTESPILGMVRAASNKNPPTEQFFSFSSFANLTVAPIPKHGIFGKKNEKFRFLLRFFCDTSALSMAQDNTLCTGGKTDTVLIIQTQTKSIDILNKIQRLYP